MRNRKKLVGVVCILGILFADVRQVCAWFYLERRIGAGIEMGEIRIELSGNDIEALKDAEYNGILPKDQIPFSVTIRNTGNGRARIYVENLLLYFDGGSAHVSGEYEKEVRAGESAVMEFALCIEELNEEAEYMGAYATISINFSSCAWSSQNFKGNTIEMMVGDRAFCFDVY